MEGTTNELDRWMQLRHWRPPPGCQSKNSEYTRSEAIDILENELVRLQENGCRSHRLEEIEAELLMHYRDLDGEWDDLPFALAAIPGIWRNLTLMHLCAYLDELPDDAVVAASTDIDQSVLNDFFRAGTPLAREQVLVQSDKALVFLGEPEVRGCQVHSVPLPHWVRTVEELTASAVIISGQPITADRLQSTIIHCLTSRYLEDLER